jgi:hypothetical protein
VRKTVTVQRRVGPGFLGLLTLLFVGLKLTGNIDWSWWWVLSPLWLPTAIMLAFVALVFVLLLIGGR